MEAIKGDAVVSRILDAFEFTGWVVMLAGATFLIYLAALGR